MKRKLIVILIALLAIGGGLWASTVQTVGSGAQTTVSLELT